MSQAAIRQDEEDADDEYLSESKEHQQATAIRGAEETLASVNSPSPVNTEKEPYYHYTVDTKDPDPWLIMHKTKIILFVIFIEVLLISTTSILFIGFTILIISNKNNPCPLPTSKKSFLSIFLNNTSL